MIVTELQKCESILEKDKVLLLIQSTLKELFYLMIPASFTTFYFIAITSSFVLS